MTKKLEALIEDIMSLPGTSRAFIAEKILESLEYDEMGAVSDAWKQEIRKRCRDIDEGAVALEEAEAVFSRSFKRIS
ncbi:MAG TPA: addiction module protein [Spirochaetota bacterium]|nr:addiction module protein [Spirochaetota bacterium]HPU89962.1 addiction module protein [Spirochaetota bacterium]